MGCEYRGDVVVQGGHWHFGGLRPDSVRGPRYSGGIGGQPDPASGGPAHQSNTANDRRGRDSYHVHCTCRTPREAYIRALLLQAVGPTPLQLLTLQSKDQEGANYVDVSAKLKTVGRKHEYLEQIVTRLSLEADVTSISWHVVSMIDTEEAELPSDAGGHG